MRPLWDGDGLGAPYTVWGRAGQKWASGDAAGTVFLSGAPKSLWGMRLEMLLWQLFVQVTNFFHIQASNDIFNAKSRVDRFWIPFFTSKTTTNALGFFVSVPI
jgi:hypothetical protein